MHDSEPTYTEISGGHDVNESTYAVVYANTGPSDVPMYDPLIVPTLPISLDDFKDHVTNCHLNDDKEFSDHYKVIMSLLLFISLYYVKAWQLQNYRPRVDA